MSQATRHRTIWLSDIHLGSRACRIDLLLDFLDRNRCECLYLVGDIIDLRRMRRSFYWPKSHTVPLERILAMARAGTRVIYVPGNHDEDFRVMTDLMLGPVEVHREIVHETRGPNFLQIKVAADKLPLVLPPKDGVHLKDRFRKALADVLAKKA